QSNSVFISNRKSRRSANRRIRLSSFCMGGGVGGGAHVMVHSNGKIRVAVLFGGQSDEHDVSLRSALTIMEALDAGKYEVVPIGITREGHWLSGGDPVAQLTATSPLFALPDGSHASVPEQIDPGVEPGGALPAVLSGDVDVVFPVLHGPMG